MAREIERPINGNAKSVPPRRGRPPLSALQDRVDTREFLMQAAGEVMIANDSADLSLSEIAEKTGLSAALVQYHFGNKEGLLVALLERDGAKAVKQLQELAEMDLPVTTKLRMHIGGLINAFFRAPYMNRLLNMLMQSEPGENSRRVSELLVKPIAEFQRNLLEQGIAEGVFRPVPPMEFYFMVVGACDHLFARRTALAHVFGIEEITEEMKRHYARTLTSTILNGITINDR